MIVNWTEKFPDAQPEVLALIDGADVPAENAGTLYRATKTHLSELEAERQRYAAIRQRLGVVNAQ